MVRQRTGALCIGWKKRVTASMRAVFLTPGWEQFQAQFACPVFTVQSKHLKLYVKGNRKQQYQ